MADPKGFLKVGRETPKRRPVEERIRDWKEVYFPMPDEKLREQASRCMDCGVPFCHFGCPLGNIIPDWNDLTYRGRWKEALDILHATNNFPDFTGRLCPAPCEEACVLGINQPAVTIKVIEQAIVEHGFAEGWVVPEPPAVRTGKKAAVIGSGPAGLAAAQQLNRAGHTVTVYERDDRIGGLLRYGIPDFKMEKWVLDRRLKQMEGEGIIFRPGVNVGVDITGDELRSEYDAICLTGGSTIPRDLPIPGRELKGIHFAMEYLTQQNRINAGDFVPEEKIITAKGKAVVILGGGDTGADCLGTAHRQGAREVYQFEILPRPPDTRTPDMPWPYWPMIFRISSAHEEGGIRDFGVSTQCFSGQNGQVAKLHAVRVEFGSAGSNGHRPMTEVEGSEFEVEAQLVLLALGFVHPQKNGLLEQLGVEFDHRSNVKTDKSYMTSVPGVFAAGDMHRGQSLVVWAISEGREAARCMDQYLMGSTQLPTNRANMIG